MLSKRQRALQNAARAAFVQIFKKEKLEANFFLNQVQLNTKNNKLSITDTSNHESESGVTWFCNISPNKTDSDFEKESCDDADENNLKE